MASVYDQAIDIVATDVKTLADAIDATITTESTIDSGSIDWDEITRNILYIAFDWNAVVTGRLDTNERTARGYPIYVMFSMPKRGDRDPRRKNLFDLREDIRQYFHRRRRMGTVSATGVHELLSMCRDGGPTPPADVRKNRDINALTIFAWFMEPHG